MTLADIVNRHTVSVVVLTDVSIVTGVVKGDLWHWAQDTAIQFDDNSQDIALFTTAPAVLRIYIYQQQRNLTRPLQYFVAETKLPNNTRPSLHEKTQMNTKKVDIILTTLHSLLEEACQTAAYPSQTVRIIIFTEIRVTTGFVQWYVSHWNNWGIVASILPPA